MVPHTTGNVDVVFVVRCSWTQMKSTPLQRRGGEEGPGRPHIGVACRGGQFADERQINHAVVNNSRAREPAQGTPPPGEGGKGCTLNPMARVKAGTAPRGENANKQQRKGVRLRGQERSPHLPGAASELRATKVRQRELTTPPDSLPG